MRDNGMGYSGKVLKLDQMQSLIQTTLAIQILYYMLVACLKISICFCCLRIGKFWLRNARLDTDKGRSCGQTFRSSRQRDRLLPRRLLFDLRYCLPDAVHPPPSNVEFYRSCIGKLHKHHCAVLQYVDRRIPTHMSLTQ
jgi:hypothetical protein